MNLTEEDRANLLVFLNRVQITGQEADVLVILKMKLRASPEKPKEAETADPL